MTFPKPFDLKLLYLLEYNPQLLLLKEIYKDTRIFKVKKQTNKKKRSYIQFCKESLGYLKMLSYLEIRTGI